MGRDWRKRKFKSEVKERDDRSTGSLEATLGIWPPSQDPVAGGGRRISDGGATISEAHREKATLAAVGRKPGWGQATPGTGAPREVQRTDGGKLGCS